MATPQCPNCDSAAIQPHCERVQCGWSKCGKCKAVISDRTGSRE